MRSAITCRTSSASCRRCSSSSAASSKTESNRLQVRVELQADCFAGIWAAKSDQQWHLIEPGDVEAAMQTAAAIGDDRLQKQAQGYAIPDSFTHGSLRAAPALVPDRAEVSGTVRPATRSRRARSFRTGSPARNFMSGRLAPAMRRY